MILVLFQSLLRNDWHPDGYQDAFLFLFRTPVRRDKYSLVIELFKPFAMIHQKFRR